MEKTTLIVKCVGNKNTNLEFFTTSGEGFEPLSPPPFYTPRSRITVVCIQEDRAKINYIVQVYNHSIVLVIDFTRYSINRPETTILYA